MPGIALPRLLMTSQIWMAISRVGASTSTCDSKDIQRKRKLRICDSDSYSARRKKKNPQQVDKRLIQIFIMLSSPETGIASSNL